MKRAPRICKWMLCAGLFFGAPALLHAQSQFQQIVDLAKNTVARLNQPPKNLDTLRFYQMKPRWSVALTGTVRQAGVEQTSTFDLLSRRPLDDGRIEWLPSSGSLYFGIKENFYTGTGINVGYGAISLGHSVEVGRKSALKNQHFQFSVLKDWIGANIQYLHYQQPLTYELTIGQPGSWDYLQNEYDSKYPGEMKVIVIDAFYAFNHKTFSLPAAYRGRKLQKRTSGSWLVGAKYLQGESLLDPREDMTSWMSDMSRFTTLQASVGGGYSLNCVFLHHDADATEKKLRNLSANVTVLPMLSFVSHISTYKTRFDIEGEPFGRDLVARSQNEPRLNFEARAGLSYVHGHFHFNLTGAYNTFALKGRSSYRQETGTYSNIQTNAVFYKWQTSLQAKYSF